jgi:hypothetical protein
LLIKLRQPGTSVAKRLTDEPNNISEDHKMKSFPVFVFLASALSFMVVGVSTSSAREIAHRPSVSRSDLLGFPGGGLFGPFGGLGFGLGFGPGLGFGMNPFYSPLPGIGLPLGLPMGLPLPMPVPPLVAGGLPYGGIGLPGYGGYPGLAMGAPGAGVYGQKGFSPAAQKTGQKSGQKAATMSGQKGGQKAGQKA